MVRKAHSKDELLTLVSDMLKDCPVIAQEYFQGYGMGVELLLDKGEPLIVFQHERIHEPLNGGGSSYRRGVIPSIDLVEASLRILRPLRYSGIAMVEFRVNKDSKKWVLIEINARFWGSLPLAVASGADFPLALYKFLLDGRIDHAPRIRTGHFCRNLTADLLWTIENIKGTRRDSMLNGRPLLDDLDLSLNNLVSRKEHIDTFSVDDTEPFFAELFDPFEDR